MSDVVARPERIRFGRGTAAHLIEFLEARRLVARPDVVVSSHRAFLSTASADSRRTRVAEEIVRVLSGGSPRHGRLTGNVVNT